MLLLAGADDAVVGDAVAAARGEGLLPDDALVCIIEGAGHAPMEETPERVGDAVADLVIRALAKP